MHTLLFDNSRKLTDISCLKSNSPSSHLLKRVQAALQLFQPGHGSAALSVGALGCCPPLHHLALTSDKAGNQDTRHNTSEHR